MYAELLLLWVQRFDDSIRERDQNVSFLEEDMLRPILASCQDSDRRSPALQRFGGHSLGRRRAVPKKERGIVPCVDVVERLV